MKCYICNNKANYLGEMPFSKNPSDLPMHDLTPMKYYKCSKCNFIFCPEMLGWDFNKFAEKVYNDEYGQLDPGYNGERAKNFFTFFNQALNPLVLSDIVHLDYGSGNSHLSGLMKSKVGHTESYDPFSSPNKPNIKFNLITAIEVFEHSTNIFNTVEDIKSMLSKNGVILFSTNLADRNTKIDWWYILARSGHIGVLSKESLEIVSDKVGLVFKSIAPEVHLLARTKPSMRNLFLRGVV
jgi:hypothetical protein